jgi:prephenate dehydratase
VRNTVRIAYFGSSGSFSEEAALAHAAKLGRASDLAGAPDPAAVLARLERGESELAVLPIANTTGGLVRASLAALGSCPCELDDEVVLPVRLSLWTRRAGMKASTIERVASHAQAFAQCTGSLARLLPGRALLEWSDTASAARSLADGSLDGHTAVLCSARAGERHGLALFAADVHDEPHNRTFFAVLRRRTPRPEVD